MTVNVVDLCALSGSESAIPRIREAILELATSGHLVSRAKREAPACESGAQIPGMDSWRLTNLEGLVDPAASISYGVLVPGPDVSGGVPFVRVQDLTLENTSAAPRKYIAPDIAAKYERTRLKGGEVLLGVVGSIGKIGIAPDSWAGASIARAVCRIECGPSVLRGYLVIALQSSSVQSYFRDQTRTLAQPTLNIGQVKATPIRVPPLAEQKRIVAKVDQLMALCDELEEKQKRKRSTCISLNKAALNAVVTAPDRRALKDSWKRVQDHFEVLYDMPENVKELRQTILQLAVMGKLVKQDPKDEPAERWVKRALSRAVAAGTRRRELHRATPGTAGTALPAGWTWATFPELGEFARGKSKHRPRNDPRLFRGGTYPLVQTGDVARAKPVIRTFSSSYNEIGLAQSRLWPSGTMCITIAANIAETGLLGFDACFPDSVVGFVPDQEAPGPAYFEYFLRTAKQRLLDFAPATAQKNINLSILEQVSIPVPPIAEMRRIVGCLERLLNYCDTLDAQHAASAAAGERLLASVVGSLTTSSLPAS